MLGLTIPHEDFKLLKPDSTKDLGNYSPKNDETNFAHRYFCKTCGTQVWREASMQDLGDRELTFDRASTSSQREQSTSFSLSTCTRLTSRKRALISLTSPWNMLMVWQITSWRERKISPIAVELYEHLRASETGSESRVRAEHVQTSGTKVILLSCLDSSKSLRSQPISWHMSKLPRCRIFFVVCARVNETSCRIHEARIADR